MSDPLMTLLINHDVFPLAPNKRDVLYSVLKAYIDTLLTEARKPGTTPWERLEPPIEVKK